MSLHSFGSLVNANSLKLKMAANTPFVGWSVLTLVINSLSYLGYAPAPRHPCHQNVVYIFPSLGMEKNGHSQEEGTSLELSSIDKLN